MGEGSQRRERKRDCDLDEDRQPQPVSSARGDMAFVDRQQAGDANLVDLAALDAVPKAEAENASTNKEQDRTHSGEHEIETGLSHEKGDGGKQPESDGDLQRQVGKRQVGPAVLVVPILGRL